MSKTLATLLLLPLAALAQSPPLPLSTSPPPSALRRALLVGCTTYDKLDSSNNLEGPANDVKLFRKLLTERFGFAPTSVITLAEAENKPTLRPIRANIEREFKALAASAKAGDQIVILMGGHGTQQPNDNPGDTSDPEPDGLDEVFLPADVAPWSTEVKSIVNAIKDDELRAWLTAIRSKGASVWFIADCCHSGTISRDINDPTRKPAERNRELRPDILVPKDLLAAAAADGAKTRGAGPAPPQPKGIVDAPAADGQGELVAMYAAQSTEPTVERRLPDEADAKARLPYGLLTFTLNQILTRATEPLTYRELTARIQQQYTAWGRHFPTPLIEGNGADREVFGSRQWPGRSLMTLSSTRDGLRVNAGSLQGLTVNTILAIFPPAGEGSQRIGYAKVTSCSALDADVVPCPYEGQPAVSKLPAGARAEIVHVDAGLAPLKVAVVSEGKPSTTFKNAIQTKMELPSEVVQFVDDPGDAKWIVRVSPEAVTLAKASATTMEPRGAPAPNGPPGSIFGPYAPDEKSERLIAENLAKIARVEHLLSLSEPIDAGRVVSGAVRVRAELWRYATKADQKGSRVDLSAGDLNLKPGEWLGFKIENQGRSAADVTLLFVDEEFGIFNLFPKTGTITDNRIEPSASIGHPDVPRVEPAIGTGLQHVVLVATLGEGPPRNFGWLEQSSIQKVRAMPIGERGAESELSQLFQHALYGVGVTRGMKTERAADHAIRTLSFRF